MMFQRKSLILSMLVLAGTTCCSTTAFTPETLLTKNNNRLSQVRLDNSVYNYNNDATATTTTTTTPATTTAPLLSLAVQQQKDQSSLPSLVLQVETLQIRVVEEGETSSSSTLPPILQDMANERKNFQMNLGKAMDTLRKDMPEILKTAPGKFFFF